MDLNKDLIFGYTGYELIYMTFTFIIGLCIGIMINLHSYEAVVEQKCNMFIMERFQTNIIPNYDDYYVDLDFNKVVKRINSTG